MARDLKFSKATLFDHSYKGLSVSNDLRSTADSFISNMDRAIACHSIVRRLSHLLRINQVAYGIACNSLFGQPSIPDNQAHRSSEVQAIADRLLDEAPFAVRADAVSKAEWQIDTAFKNIDSMIPGGEAILSSVIVGAWTAFESLAGDLWEAILNLRPKLAIVAIGAQIATDENETESERKYRMTTPLPVHMLNDPAFNIQTHMGSILRAQGKFDFARREQAKDAYKKTFPQLWPQIEPIFDDRRLRWLAKLRNVILHHAAVADLEFVTAFAEHPELRGFQKGDHVALDGVIVANLAESAALAGVQLIKLVDGWLSKN
jgi:hypothetical protein